MGFFIPVFAVDFNFILDYNRVCLTALSAQVVELVDTPDLGSGAARCGGSSPLLGIIFEQIRSIVKFT